MTGVLADFSRVGVLEAPDRHVALRLGRLGGEADERVLLAAALTVRALRGGSVRLDVATAGEDVVVEGASPEEVAALDWPETDSWLTALRASGIVAAGVAGEQDRPLRLIGTSLYLDRYWRQEQRIAQVLDEAASWPPPTVDEARLEVALDRLFGRAAASGTDRQRLAAGVAARRWVSVLAGGPGTGKTTTVARLLAALQDQADGSLRVALAAPTAVAAARLSFAVRGVARNFEPVDRERVAHLQAVTLHRLLGRTPESRTRFRHHRDNRLPHDVVVVDESSMVSLTLMSRLVDALRPRTRLLLVGDPDQLASVEAGAVLGDLVVREPPPGAAGTSVTETGLVDDERASAERGVVRLQRVHRFTEEIQSLAEAVRSGDPDAVTAVLETDHEHIELLVVGEDLAPLRDDVVSAGSALHEAARLGDGTEALVRLARHQVLCAHREGPAGIREWGAQAEAWLREAVRGYAAQGPWYVGRPLLVTSNDYQLRLFNGDTGVVVDVEGRPRAAFVRNGVTDLIAPSRLSQVQTVHALSVHRAQGSQYDRVTLVLPPVGSPLLTRELLYTGLTRARQHVRIVASLDAIVAAVRRPVVRASGLRERLG